MSFPIFSSLGFRNLHILVILVSIPPSLPLQDFPFEDGAAPPIDIIKQWMELVVQMSEQEQGSCIAVHYVAGLGRAPVLVAVALIEYGLKYHVAVEKIRE